MDEPRITETAGTDAELADALATAGIRASRQFAALCPTAAILMHRSLP